MLISTAMAADAVAAAGTAPSPWEAFALNMMLILILVVLFYVLLIMPQQKRFKKHNEMLGLLKKGDKVITSSGFVATIDKIKEKENEVVLDLGGGVKVTALRSSIQTKANEN